MTLFRDSLILQTVKPKAADQIFYRQFGQLLAEIRRKKGMSQELLADELGLSRTSITYISVERHHPSICAFHDLVLDILDNGEWKVSPIQPRCDQVDADS